MKLFAYSSAPRWASNWVVFLCLRFFYNVNTFSFKFQQLRKQWVDRSDNISEENDEICKIRENLLVHVVSWLFQIVIILIIILIIIFYIFMSMCLPLDAYVITAVVLWQKKNIILPLVRCKRKLPHRTEKQLLNTTRTCCSKCSPYSLYRVAQKYYATILNYQ